MLNHVETMFDNVQDMLKKLKKKTYKANMDGFLSRNRQYLDEMTEYVGNADDKGAAANEIAKLLIDHAEDRFSGKNGKIKSRQQADLNFFMIYYVFPAILLTENEYADQIAKSVCSEWGTRFKDSKINYTDYDSIYNTFNEKILGIF